MFWKGGKDGRVVARGGPGGGKGGGLAGGGDAGELQARARAGTSLIRNTHPPRITIGP